LRKSFSEVPHEAERAGELLPLPRRQRVRRAPRIDADLEARLDRVDVADPRDRALVEQRIPDRDRAVAEPRAQHRAIEAWIERLRTELVEGWRGPQRRPRRDPQRPEAARIHEA
jgi:hypothetical protein